MYLQLLLLLVASVVCCLHDVVVFADRKADEPVDRNGVCFVDGGEGVVCPLSEEGDLPSLQLIYDQYGKSVVWDQVLFSCYPSSTGSIFDITLTSSIFGNNFTALLYEFNFGYCNFIWSPDDLFSNIALSSAGILKLSYYLSGRSSGKYHTIYFTDQPFELEVDYYNINDSLSVSRSLAGSAVVGVEFSIDCQTIPSETFTNMPNLTRIQIYAHTLLVESRAFWRLPDHIEIVFVLYYNLVTLETKAISEIVIVDRVTFEDSLRSYVPILKNIEIGAIHAIESISNMSLHVMHDAFEGSIFSNVSHVGRLVLTIYPSHPNCTVSSVQCMVNIDFGATTIDRLDIIMIDTTFVLPSNHSFSRIHTLGITLQLCGKGGTIYHLGDPWIEAGNIYDIIEGVKIAELNIGHQSIEYRDPGYHCTPSHPFFLPINLTNTILESVQLINGNVNRNWHSPNPICDSSWLTVSKSLKSLQFLLNYPNSFTNHSNPYPLIIRSPLISNITAVAVPDQSRIVDCGCSMTWLKQMMDCPTGVQLSSQWLQNNCSFDETITVEQFLNSTRCCTSTEPPTTNNEPNMPLDCDKFLPIPPELLYFNHTDLPQCRESRDWEWDPCNVLAFYERLPSPTKTTYPTTMTKPTTVTSTSTDTNTDSCRHYRVVGATVDRRCNLLLQVWSPHTSMS